VKYPKTSLTLLSILQATHNFFKTFTIRSQHIEQPRITKSWKHATT